MKIGLLGGTFNPIHRCHLSLAAEVRDRLHLDRILFIPTGNPPHKPASSLAPAGHRVEMVRRAIAGNPAFALSEVETQRPSTSYSVETVRMLRAEYGPAAEFFFIIGLDAFREFSTWKEAADLLHLSHFVVVPRASHTFRSLSGLPLLPAVNPASLAALDDRREERLDVPFGGGTTMILLSLPPCDVSASDIREKLRNRRSLSNLLLPASVESYIMQHRLYQEGSDRTGV
ncbi:MAG TPA: nicotinate-nucleotide adenylyltransferase [Nitrospiraceae bacterium]|jgi:nicotinate-nucleotide adenylyltransferase|nr:nicotinate-nucleotide adenylyltransferase [Nitrospiraceae bacterium]